VAENRDDERDERDEAATPRGCPSHYPGFFTRTVGEHPALTSEVLTRAGALAADLRARLDATYWPQITNSVAAVAAVQIGLEIVVSAAMTVEENAGRITVPPRQTPDGDVDAIPAPVRELYRGTCLDARAYLLSLLLDLLLAPTRDALRDVAADDGIELAFRGEFVTATPEASDLGEMKKTAVDALLHLDLGPAASRLKH
jgi:hypothetical protein